MYGTIPLAAYFSKRECARMACLFYDGIDLLNPQLIMTVLALGTEWC
jgi:hypothetical protein